MCHSGPSRRRVRRDFLLFILSTVLLVSGSCENEEPGDLFAGSREPTESEQPRRDDPYDDATTDHQRFKWVGSEDDGISGGISSSGGGGLDDEHVAPAARSPLAETDGETKTPETPRPNGDNNSNNAETSELTDSDNNAGSSRRSRVGPAYRCDIQRNAKTRRCINEARLKKRRRYASGSRGASTGAGDTRLSLSNGIRGSSSRNRRIQERGQTRAKNRGRKRNGKRARQQQQQQQQPENGGARTRGRKSKSKGVAAADAPLAIRRASRARIRNSSATNDTASAAADRRRTDGKSESRGDDDEDFNSSRNDDSDDDDGENDVEVVENEVVPSVFTEQSPVARYERREDNVERELSKNLEKELLWSRTERPRAHNFSNHQESSMTRPAADPIPPGGRFDAARMLGYSRSAEDLPIMDLENEVLARTLEDYNAYLKSGGRAAKSVRHGGERADSATTTSVGREENVPIPPARPSYRRGSDEQQQQQQQQRADSEPGTDVKGDISCINGTFVPAPLSRHALIKYVKSSIPGHEYLEADYECAPGYRMTSRTSRLLCKDHRWLGELPSCEIRRPRAPDSCGESACDQVCNEVNGVAECSCYEGFRLDGTKCIDINECESGNGGCERTCVNTPGSYRCECPRGMKRGEDKFACTDVNECLLNNGHGPCQDTCRNLEGGYACSCEGLPGTSLAADNHTCRDAGACAVDNAGCSHTCLSTMGRVFCLCPDGFVLADDWKTCQDVDECSVPDLQTEICRYECVNTPGSYRCVEPAELAGDEPARESLSISCLPGYEPSAESSCVDTNECAIDNGGCSEVCENTEGSFFCACDGDEKVISGDGKSCIDITDLACPPLDPARRGYLMCSRETTPRLWRGGGGDVRRATNRAGTKCYLKCPTGYQLHGEYELTCQGDGTWDGPKHGECVKYSKPRLECPKDVMAEVPPDRDEAFVTFDQPSTDLDWFRYVRSKPSWGTRLEASLKPGLHLVTFFARHPVSKKQASCVLRIIVKEGEAPRVNNCPKDMVGKNGTSFAWTEPTFTDNVRVTRTSKTENPGKIFGVGEWRVEYEASDEAGWTTRCVFSVVVHQD